VLKLSGVPSQTTSAPSSSNAPRRSTSFRNRAPAAPAPTPEKKPEVKSGAIDEWS